MVILQLVARSLIGQNGFVTLHGVSDRRVVLDSG